jgi:hypothetical protein
LFADLEAQYDAEQRLELGEQVRDRTRREVASLRLVDRLRPAAGVGLEVAVEGAGTIHGRLQATGADWLLLDVTGQPAALVAVAAVLGVRGLPGRAEAPGSEGRVGSRLDLGYALRGIARDRSPVRVLRRDGGVLTGTVDRVGADFLDVAEHPLDAQRRAGSVMGATSLPLSAVAVVRPA